MIKFNEDFKFFYLSTKKTSYVFGIFNKILLHLYSPVTVSDTVTIFIEIGGKKEKLLTWETGEIAGKTNKIGPTVNYIMPTSFEVSEFVVWLETLSGKANNNYKLRYNCTEQPEKIRLMNQ